MPVRIALIGTGHMGLIHLQKLVAMGDVHVAGVTDIDTDRARQSSDKYCVACHDDIADLMGRVDGVIIATPTESHFPIARAFLEQGVNVFIEKPITSTPDEAVSLVDLAREKGLTVQVGHLERFNPAFREAVARIENPLLIETNRLSTFTGRSVDIDVVLDLMIHDIDLVLSLVPSTLREVRSQGIPFVIDKVDAASARLQFENGCVATLNASRISLRKERNITVFERDRYFFIDLLNNALTVCTRSASGAIETAEYFPERKDAVNEELLEFISSIREGSTPSVRGEDGLKALELAKRVTTYITEGNDYGNL